MIAASRSGRLKFGKHMFGKHQIINAGFAMFEATKLYRLVEPWTRGQGAILMFHHVRPSEPRGFKPNDLLEITPEFLDAVLARVKALGFDIVSLDEAVASLGEERKKPFVCLTFDDGYRDFTEHALPVLERHAAPFTVYVTTGFADRTARLWWVELEEAIRALPVVEVTVRGERFSAFSATDQEKADTFKALYALLRAGPEEDLLAAVAELAHKAGIAPFAAPARLCLDWKGVATLARHSLATIGAHSLTHAMLAKHNAEMARQEMAESRRLIEEHIGKVVDHFAYPVGDPTSAGVRDFAIAEELGFASAVTTRPGMIFRDHAAHPTALPRLSINGLWQRLDVVEVLLSGAPFALWNRGQKLNVA